MLSLINQFVYRPDATFAPHDLTPAHLSLAYEEVFVDTEDGVRLHGWYLPAPEARHALLYCHGNAGNVRDWIHAAPAFLSAGCSVLLWDYRGYGSSEGEPSEEGLYRDGAAVWSWLQTRARAEGIPASLLGKSLGSAVAIDIAARASADEEAWRPACLILDSAFTSMRLIVGLAAPVFPAHLIPPLYESLEKAPQIEAPTLVIYGGQDSLVPPEQGEQIYEALGGEKERLLIPQAGHNDISSYPNYYDAILAFLEAHTPD